MADRVTNGIHELTQMRQGDREIGHIGTGEKGCLACDATHEETERGYEPCRNQAKARELVSQGFIPYVPSDY